MSLVYPHGVSHGVFTWCLYRMVSQAQFMTIIKEASAGKPSEEDQTMLQSVLEDCLQTVVVMPVQDRLISAYKRRFAPLDAKLIRRQVMLQQQRQVRTVECRLPLCEWCVWLLQCWLSALVMDGVLSWLAGTSGFLWNWATLCDSRQLDARRRRNE